MTLKLNGSSSGYTAIDAPASAGSNTITLPANNGSANHYLKNSGTAGVLEFAALSAGKLLQVQETYFDTDSTSTSSDFPVASGIKRTITPSATSSKILIIASIAAYLYDGSSTNRIGLFGIRNNTATKTLLVQRVGCSLGNAGNVFIPVTLVKVDEPNSTSEQEYEITYGSYASYSDATIRFGNGWGDTIDSVSMKDATTLTCIEVAG